MIDDYRVKTDDIAFDQDGFMYLSDENGTLDDPHSLLIRLDQEGLNPIVLYKGFAGSNGIVFSLDYSNL